MNLVGAEGGKAEKIAEVELPIRLSAAEAIRLTAGCKGAPSASGSRCGRTPATTSLAGL